MVEKLPRPKLPPPVKVGGGGKIVIKVSGRLTQKAQGDNAVIERID